MGRTHHPAIKGVTFTPTGNQAAELEAVLEAARVRRVHAHRRQFMTSVITMDQAALITQLQTLAEQGNEEESREGRRAIKAMEAFVTAAGKFRFPETFDAAVRDHFQGQG